MSKELTLYISAGPEMDDECELLGRVLARMPHGVKWVIKRTPGPFEDGTPDRQALQTSSFYLILLGMDIYAPMGVEWQLAQGSGAFVMAYRNSNALPSPAAAHFAHNTGLVWDYYATAEELTVKFERRLVEQLISGTPGYGLELEDIEALLTLRKQIQERDGNPEETSDDRRGAGYGGVILADH